jgi:hypothetical protein
MSHRKKRHGPALTQRTAPLPVLSNQDLKVVFAQEGQAHPQTTVEFQIPLDYDILCAQGCRDWQAQRAITIEQTDITTIKSDALADPSQLRMRAQPVDQFEGLDAKLREIEVEAEAMRKDFDLLDIP